MDSLVESAAEQACFKLYAGPCLQTVARSKANRQVAGKGGSANQPHMGWVRVQYFQRCPCA